MSGPNRTGWFAVTVSTLAGVGVAMKILPKLLKAVIGGMRSIIAFSDAIPDIQRLPKTLSEHKAILIGQNIELGEIKNEQSRLRGEQEEMEKRLARYIVHEARKDLNHSRLLEESERLLKELDERNRSDKPRIQT